MIRSVEIRGLRGIREGALDDLTPLVILVGPNGCGKSTVLEALLLGTTNTIGEAVGQCVLRRSSVWNGVRWLAAPRSRVHPDDWHVRVRSVSGRSRAVILIAQSTVVEISVNSADESGAGRFGVLSGVLFEGNNTYRVDYDYLAADPFHRLVESARLIEPKPDVTQPPLHRVYSAAVQNGRRREAESFAASVLPRFVNLEILTAPDSDAPEVNVVFESGAIPLGLAGDGVQGLVRQCLELAALKDGVALFEEPEAFKHPAATRQTARAIVAAAGRGVQIVLSTHSLELIDAIVDASDSEKALARLSLYRLALDQGKLTSSRLVGAEVRQLRSQIDEDLR